MCADRRSKFLTAALLTLILIGFRGTPLTFAASVLSSQAEWSRTVEAAAKEGQVNVYMYATCGNTIQNATVFQKAFPNIRLSLVTGNVPDLSQRIMAERRAGKYLADVIVIGVNVSRELLQAKMPDPVKPALILPEVVDESKWWRSKHLYADPENQFIFKFSGNPQYGSISYNTKLAREDDFKSIWDFVNPKWKGKIIARDVTPPGPGNGAMRFFYDSPKIGQEFIKRLYGQMDITLFRDGRVGVDWLANWKYAICFFCASDVYKAASQGLPVDVFGPMKEGGGLVSGYGALVIPKVAPHPSATKVFVNWLLSREGQLTLQKALSGSQEEPPDSLRIDIPKDEIPADNRRRDGIDYMDLDSREEWMQRDGYVNLVKSTMAKNPKE
jgi:ABC-type Fe3+ transport system substrate-binding protein